MHRTIAEQWCLIATKESLVSLPGLAGRNVWTQKIYTSYCSTLTDDVELTYVSGYWSIVHHVYYQIYQILMKNVFFT